MNRRQTPVAAAVLLGSVLAFGLATGSANAGSGQTNPSAGPTKIGTKPNVKPWVVFVKTKRFTSCSSGGKDKNWCKDNL